MIMDPFRVRKPKLTFFILASALILAYFIFVGDKKEEINNWKSNEIIKPGFQVTYVPCSKCSTPVRRPKEQYDKLNATGQYLPYYGYTVISMLHEQLNHVEEFFRNTQTLSKYVAGLPASSYHITMYDIVNQRHQSLDSMGGLHSALSEAQSYCDQMKGEVVFKIHNFRLHRTPGHTLVIQGNVTNMKETTKLRDKCVKLFKKKDKKRIFHLSLGYTFREIDDDAVNEIDTELKSLWNLLKGEYKLLRPNVYYFDSMEKFVPLRIHLLEKNV